MNIEQKLGEAFNAYWLRYAKEIRSIYESKETTAEESYKAGFYTACKWIRQELHQKQLLMMEQDYIEPPEDNYWTRHMLLVHLDDLLRSALEEGEI